MAVVVFRVCVAVDEVVAGRDPSGEVGLRIEAGIDDRHHRARIAGRPAPGHRRVGLHGRPLRRPEGVVRRPERLDTAIGRRPGHGGGGPQLGEVARPGLDDIDPQLGDGGDPGEPQSRLQLLHVGSPAGPVADLEPGGSSRRRYEGRQRERDRGQWFSHRSLRDRAAKKPAQVSGRSAPLPGMTNRRLHPPRRGLLAVLLLALVCVSAASTASTPLLQLGPVTVANDTATLAGTVASGSSTATLTVNGQPVGLDAAGAFSATVPLNGAGTLALALRQGGTTQQTTFQIPLTGSLIPAGVLDSLEQAGISLLAPTGVGNGEPLTVSGGVLDHGSLSSLTVNGQDVLGTLGSGGTFTVQVPGTTKVITLSAVDKNGSSETIQTPVSIPATVSAKNAVGVRFARIAFSTKNVRKTHRVRMTVTIRDLRGSLVKGATVSVRSLKRGRLQRTPKSGLTGPKGRATIVLPLRMTAFGRRLTVNTVARTPSAKVSRKGNVRIPKPRHKRHS